MPTYEYECIECGYRFEKFQKMSESPLQECLNCSGQVRRLLSGGSGLIFKGSGFYITDYAHSKGGESGSETKNESSTKTDSSKNKSTDK